VNVSDPRIIDRCGTNVSVMHLSVFHWPTPLIPDRELEASRERWNYDPWERAADLTAWTGMVQRARARALGDQALDETPTWLHA
jgi:hypothetical protein